MELNLVNLTGRPALKGITDTTRKERRCHILELEDELIVNIMEFLSLTALMNLANTCKRMNSLSATQVLWERLDLQDHFLKPGKLAYILERNPKYMRLARAKIMSPQFMELPFHANQLNLSYVDLSNAEISHITLSKFLSQCKNLRKLSLEGLSLGVDVFKNVTPKLKVLNLTMTSNLFMPYFAPYLQETKLQILNVCWIEKKWTEYSFMNLIQSLPKTLLQLNISGYAKFMSNLHVKELVERCPLLERLDISDNYGLTTECIRDIARLKNLHCLAMNRCTKVGLVALEPLRNLKNFNFIELSGLTMDTCPAEKLEEWLGVCVNRHMFLNIGRPTSESYPDYIWKRLVHIDRD